MRFLSFTRRFELLLGGHLGVAVAPRAELEAAADPAQAFAGVGGAFLSAHGAGGGLAHPFRFDRAPGLL